MNKNKQDELHNDIETLLELRNKRVRLEIGEFHGLPKYSFYVPGRDLHYFNRVIAEVIPMGVYVDVRRLKVWECRIEKIQLPEGF